MNGKAFFIDTSKCTACRGCQIACKQWNGLPATKTKNWGSHQNPRDLSFETYKVVRFNEHLDALRTPVWYFFPDQCRHCVEPPCMLDAEDQGVKGAIIQDASTGAVLYTNLTSRLDFVQTLESCPYNIPRKDKDSNIIAKCTMCLDRLQNGMLPACVKVCPTGTMNFGDRDKMVALAKTRLTEVQKKHPHATVTGLDELRVFYLLVDKPGMYYEYARVAPFRIIRNAALRRSRSKQIFA